MALLGQSSGLSQRRALPPKVTGLTGVRSLGGGASGSSRLRGDPAASGQLRSQGPAYEWASRWDARRLSPSAHMLQLAPSDRTRKGVWQGHRPSSGQQSPSRRGQVLARPPDVSTSLRRPVRTTGCVAQGDLVTGAECHGGFNPAGWLRGPLS